MTGRYVSRLETLAAPRWVRAVMVLVMVGFVFGNLLLITVGLTDRSGPRRILLLVALWAIGVVAFALLARLWRVLVISRENLKSRSERGR
jgi:hypothetical protein